MKTLYLLQKDLRLNENKALYKACQSEELLFLYLKPDDFDQLSSQRKNFIKESLIDLEENLSKVGHQFYIVDCLNDILFSRFDRVVVSKSYNSKDQVIERQLGDLSESNEFDLQIIENSTLYQIDSLPFDLESLPDIFTEYRKKIEMFDVNLLEAKKTSIPKTIKSTSFKTITSYFTGYNLGDKNLEFNGGESKAQSHLKRYLWEHNLALTYKKTRNGMLDFDDSTKFSPWLSLGCISPVTIMKELKLYEDQVEKNDSTYWIYFELLWRDYFKLYALKHKDKIFNINGLEKKKFVIQNKENLDTLFRKWRLGESGISFIDANMKELFLTGWMSNRGRQNVASYLSKELMIDWRLGAQWFAKKLIDYDVESNWGNWNYIAGVGADPRDRKFNIQRQAELYDSEKIYQKKWIES